jgi:hypothetical protein
LILVGNLQLVCYISGAFHPWSVSSILCH